MATFSAALENGAADVLPYMHGRAVKNLGPVPTTRVGVFKHTTSDFASGTVIQMVPVFKGETVISVSLSAPDLMASGCTLDVGETAASPATEDALVGVSTGADPDRYYDGISGNAVVDDNNCLNSGRYTYDADDTIDIVTGGAVFDTAPDSAAQFLVMTVTVIGS